MVSAGNGRFDLLLIGAGQLFLCLYWLHGLFFRFSQQLSLIHILTGSLNVFNHQSNVDINNRIVCYDIKELGKQLKNCLLYTSKTADCHNSFYRIVAFFIP